MNTRAIFAIVRKDLKVVRQNKNVVTPIIIIAVVFFVGFPWVIGQAPAMVKGFGGEMTTMESYIAKLPPGLANEFAGYSINQQMIMFALLYMLVPFFLMIPLMVASMIAADSFAGEKERKTLEALLYTPTTDRELFVAKMLAGWLAAMVVALVGFVIYAINANAAGWSQLHQIFFPNTMWLVLILWVVPALSGLGVGLMVVVSARAQGFQDANQMAGLVVLPIMALFYAQLAGVIYLNIVVMLVIGLVVWLLTGLLVWLGSKSFHRNRMLAA